MNDRENRAGRIHNLINEEREALGLRRGEIYQSSGREETIEGICHIIDMAAEQKAAGDASFADILQKPPVRLHIIGTARTVCRDFTAEDAQRIEEKILNL